MTRSTTALLRRIDAEQEAKRQLAWAERSADRTRIRNPKWACDHLLEAGQITARQHEAARRYASVIERSQPGGRAGVERVDGGDSDPHARAWDAAVSISIVSAGRQFVLRAPAEIAGKRAFVLDRLFAFDGARVTGPLPTMNQIRAPMRPDGGMRQSYERVSAQVRGVLDLLDMFWRDRDFAH